MQTAQHNATPNLIHLSLLAQVVGNTFGAEVIEDPSANTFSTDGKKMYIPVMIGGGQQTAALIRGGIAHEAGGHMAHTDFKYRNKWIIGKPALTNSIRNIIEDTRIERQCIRTFPGSRKILSDLVAELDRRKFFQMPEDPKANPGGALATYLNRALRAEESGQPLDVVEAQTAVDEIYGKELRQKILEVAKKATHGEHVSYACNAADSIASLLKDAATPPPPPEEPQDPQQQPQDQPQDGQGQQGESGSGEGQEDPSASPQKGKGKKQPSGTPGSEAGDPGEPTPQQIAEAAQKALDATEGEVGTGDIGEMIGEAVQSDKKQKGGGVSALPGKARRSKAPKSLDAFVPDVDASSLAIRLQARLAEHLRSRMEDEDDDDTDRGRLNTRRLVKGLLGDRQIFTVEGQEGEGLNTAVFILADESGSMDTDGKDVRTLAALYAICSAMGQYEMQGVAFAISTFGESVKDLKRFDGPWIHEKNNLNRYNANNGTRFNGSLEAVLPDLIARKECRKVMYVITDGDLGQTNINKMLCETARREAGVEVRVLMIGSTKTDFAQCERIRRDNGFSSVISVSSSDDLLTPIFDTLKELT